jgi:molybdopterin converting factor subunit 1
MMRLRVHYFAILRDQRGLAQESLSTAAKTAAELYEELRGRHGFTLAGQHLRAAVNEEFVPWGAALRDGDAVAFLPPVAGG